MRFSPIGQDTMLDRRPVASHKNATPTVETKSTRPVGRLRRGPCHLCDKTPGGQEKLLSASQLSKRTAALVNRSCCAVYIRSSKDYRCLGWHLGRDGPAPLARPL